jgi:Kef-type K+ transport system membrane component KefB
VVSGANETTEFIVGLFLLVTCSVVIGEVFTRMGSVALVGQLLVGVVLGPTLLAPYLGLTTVASQFSPLLTLATFFILLMAGLAVSPEQVWATGPPAVLLGVSIFLVPFLAGAGVVHVLFPAYSSTTDLFIALTLSITALPVLAIMLREFGLMNTRFGTFLLNASVINELSAVTAFAILLSVSSSGQSPTLAVAEAGVTVALFLSAILSIHMALRALRQLRLWDRVVQRFRETWRSRGAGFAVLMVLGLSAALFSQALGLTFLVGAFYAGMLVTPESAGIREHRTISAVFDAITWGFFIPLFFALVGFGMNFRLVFTSEEGIVVFGLLVAFALIAKILIGSAVTRSLRWSSQESMAAGWLLTSRGAVELAMAVILLDIGVFTTTLYTIVAGVGLVTTLLSPLGARGFVQAVSALRREPVDASRQPPVGSSIPLPPATPPEERPIL